MDIARAKQKKNWIKRYWPWMLVVVPVLFAIEYLWFLGQADFSVDGDSMVYGEVCLWLSSGPSRFEKQYHDRDQLSFK